MVQTMEPCPHNHQGKYNHGSNTWSPTLTISKVNTTMVLTLEPHPHNLQGKYNHGSNTGALTISKVNTTMVLH